MIIRLYWDFSLEMSTYENNINYRLLSSNISHLLLRTLTEIFPWFIKELLVAQRTKTHLLLRQLYTPCTKKDKHTILYFMNVILIFQFFLMSHLSKNKNGYHESLLLLLDCFKIRRTIRTPDTSVHVSQVPPFSGVFFSQDTEWAEGWTANEFVTETFRVLWSNFMQNLKERKWDTITMGEQSRTSVISVSIVNPSAKFRLD